MKRLETIKIFGIIPFIPLFLISNISKTNTILEKPIIVKGGYNLVIYGATRGGIACAVRAAREGSLQMD
jgi:hypothetical protein